MRLPEIGVRRPVATAMFFIAIVIVGLVCLTQLGIDMMPDIEIPTIGVITTYQEPICTTNRVLPAATIIRKVCWSIFAGSKAFGGMP